MQVQSSLDRCVVCECVRCISQPTLPVRLAPFLFPLIFSPPKPSKLPSPNAFFSPRKSAGEMTEIGLRRSPQRKCVSRPQNGGVAPLAEVESNARNLLHADSSWRRVESLHLGDLASISTSGQKQMVKTSIRTPCYFAHFILMF